METAVLRVHSYWYAKQSNRQRNLAKLQNSLPGQKILLHDKPCFFGTRQQGTELKVASLLKLFSPFVLFFFKIQQLWNKLWLNYSNLDIWSFYWLDLSNFLQSSWPFHVPAQASRLIILNADIYSRHPCSRHQICTKIISWLCLWN